MKLLEIKRERLKKIAVLFFLALFLLVILFKYVFVISKILALRPYEDSLRNEVKNYVTRIAVMNKLNEEEFKKELDLLNKRFPKKEEIPTILDGLERLARKAEVEITSISQQRLEKPVTVNVKFKGGSYNFSYQALSLTMSLTSSYIQLAKFLEALDNWHGGIVVVKGFGIQRDNVISEKLKVDNLIIEIATIGDSNE